MRDGRRLAKKGEGWRRGEKAGEEGRRLAERGEEEAWWGRPPPTTHRPPHPTHKPQEPSQAGADRAVGSRDQLQLDGAARCATGLLCITVIPPLHNFYTHPLQRRHTAVTPPSYHRYITVAHPMLHRPPLPAVAAAASRASAARRPPTLSRGWAYRGWAFRRLGWVSVRRWAGQPTQTTCPPTAATHHLGR